MAVGRREEWEEKGGGVKKTGSVGHVVVRGCGEEGEAGGDGGRSQGNKVGRTCSSTWLWEKLEGEESKSVKHGVHGSTSVEHVVRGCGEVRDMEGDGRRSQGNEIGRTCSGTWLWEGGRSGRRRKRRRRVKEIQSDFRGTWSGCWGGMERTKQTAGVKKTTALWRSRGTLAECNRHASPWLQVKHVFYYFLFLILQVRHVFIPGLSGQTGRWGA